MKYSKELSKLYVLSQQSSSSNLIYKYCEVLTCILKA